MSNYETKLNFPGDVLGKEIFTEFEDNNALVVVVPCFNEFKRLPASDFSQFIGQHNNIHFCFVNDASNDASLDLLWKLKEVNPKHVSILDLKENVGKAEAVRQGMLFCCSNLTFNFIAFLDADLSAPLSELIRLYQIIKKENLAFVFGARVAVYGSKIKRLAVRHYLGRVFASMASVLLNMVIYDTQCGLKIFRTDIAEQLFNKSFLSRWLFDVEIIARLKLKYNEYDLINIMREIPLYEWVEKGDSKIKLEEILLTPFYMININYQYKKRRRKQELFYAGKQNNLD